MLALPCRYKDLSSDPQTPQKASCGDACVSQHSFSKVGSGNRKAPGGCRATELAYTAMTLSQMTTELVL